jgi:hypothetical protein
MKSRSLHFPSAADRTDWGVALVGTVVTLALTALATGSIDKAVNSVAVGTVTAFPLFILCCVKLGGGDTYYQTQTRVRALGLTFYLAFLALAAVICRTVG